ncbi:MAG: GNAT family N-acetyltransferase [Paracoccaceae bacterium]
MTIPLPERPTLQGARVILRAPHPSDVAGRLALGNTPDIHRMFGADPAQTRPLTPEAAEAWVQAQIAEANAWVIEVDGTLIGALRLHTLNHADRNARLAIGILDADSLGQGLGTEAMRVIAAHAFGDMGLHRLSLRVLAFNERAIAAYRKVGFVDEGRERQSACIAGEWHDDLIMGLLASEFQP